MHNRVAFSILDLDHDKELNINNLMDLHQNLHPQTPVGNEVFKCLKWYMEENIESKKQSKAS